MVHEWWLAMTGGWWLMFHADWWLVVDDSSWIMDDLIASNWWSIIIDDYLMCIDGQWCVMNDVDWSWLMVVDQDWLMMRDYQTFVPDSEILLTLHDWWWVIMIDNDLFMLSDWWWLTIPMMVNGEHWWWWWWGGGGELCETLETFNSVYVVFFNPGCVIEGCNHSTEWTCRCDTFSWAQFSMAERQCATPNFIWNSNANGNTLWYIDSLISPKTWLLHIFLLNIFFNNFLIRSSRKSFRCIKVGLGDPQDDSQDDSEEDRLLWDDAEPELLPSCIREIKKSSSSASDTSRNGGCSFLILVCRGATISWRFGKDELIWAYDIYCIYIFNQNLF